MASGGPRVPGANTYGDVDDNIPGLSMTHYYAWRHDFIELRKKWARAEVPSPARLFCPECTHRTFLASHHTPLAHRCGCRADSPSPSRQALADAWHDAEFLVRHAQWQLGALHAIKDSPPDERLAVLKDWLSREPTASQQKFATWARRPRCTLAFRTSTGVQRASRRAFTLA